MFHISKKFIWDFGLQFLSGSKPYFRHYNHNIPIVHLNLLYNTSAEVHSQWEGIHFQPIRYSYENVEIVHPIFDKNDLKWFCYILENKFEVMYYTP